VIDKDVREDPRLWGLLNLIGHHRGVAVGLDHHHGQIDGAAFDPTLAGAPAIERLFAEQGGLLENDALDLVHLARLQDLHR
jgi:hypothetical protein